LWGELFEHYRARLLVRIRFRMTPAVRSRIPPDDVIQEAYLRAFERRNRMTDPTGRGPMRWLGAICDRVLDEMLKRENRRMVASFDDAPEPARATTPSKHVQRGETIRRAERVLDAMEDDDRRLVLWFYYEDLDHDEIARRLGTSVVAARKRLERARRRMSEISSRLDLTEGAVAMPHEIGG
jgi:RNA polymerase sigma factor (sigma-70 family)